MNSKIKRVQDTCPNCLKAPTGCCTKHSMQCPVCGGTGSVSRDTWGKFQKKQSNDYFLSDALLYLQKHDRDYKIEIWFDGSHYDHGDEPAIKISYQGKQIYSDWGIFLPDLIIQAGSFLRNYKPGEDL